MAWVTPGRSWHRRGRGVRPPSAPRHRRSAWYGGRRDPAVSSARSGWPRAAAWVQGSFAYADGWDDAAGATAACAGGRGLTVSRTTCQVLVDLMWPGNNGWPRRLTAGAALARRERHRAAWYNGQGHCARNGRGACRWCTSEGETLSRERTARPRRAWGVTQAASPTRDREIGWAGRVAGQGDPGGRGRGPVRGAGLGRADRDGEQQDVEVHEPGFRGGLGRSRPRHRWAKCRHVALVSDGRADTRRSARRHRRARAAVAWTRRALVT